MDKLMIIRAGSEAREVALAMADMIRRSQVPAAHWDEVLERLKDILMPAMSDRR